MSSVEYRRILFEWSTRFRRVKEILAPPEWTQTDWQVFSCSLAVLIQKHGLHWQKDQKKYWDLRWNIREGGVLICQIEQHQDEYVSVVVAQSGGFAGERGYTWLWSDLNLNGEFLREPYFVDGTWKEALVALLMPFSQRAAFFLSDRAESPPAQLEDEHVKTKNS